MEKILYNNLILIDNLSFFSTAYKPISANIPNFSRHRKIIIDCWLLYNYKNFKDEGKQLRLKYFPLWNTSKEVSIRHAISSTLCRKLIYEFVYLRRFIKIIAMLFKYLRKMAYT